MTGKCPDARHRWDRRWIVGLRRVRRDDHRESDVKQEDADLAVLEERSRPKSDSGEARTLQLQAHTVRALWVGLWQYRHGGPGFSVQIWSRSSTTSLNSHHALESQCETHSGESFGLPPHWTHVLAMRRPAQERSFRRRLGSPIPTLLTGLLGHEWLWNVTASQ